jgi:hypothetical protein
MSLLRENPVRAYLSGLDDVTGWQASVKKK